MQASNWTRRRRVRALCLALTLGVLLGQAGALARLAFAVSAAPAEDAAPAANTVRAGTPGELQQALNGAVQGTTILLTDDMTLSAPLSVNKQNMAVKLQAEGDSVTLTAASSRHLQCAGARLDLVFEGVTLDGAGRGGGIVSTVAGLSLAGVRVQNCVAGSGGGVEAASGSVYIEDGCVIENNRATGQGGGVSAGQGAIVNIDGGIVRGNRAGAYGGGVFGGVGSTVRVDGGLIHDNEAVLGGGLYAGLANTTLLDGGTISANRATGGGDGGRGGGVYAVTCDVIVDGAEIIENRAMWGAGVYATGDGSDVVLQSGAIRGNEAQGADAWGGGVYLDVAYSVPNTLTLSGGELAGNHAVRGGGAWASGSRDSGGSNNPGGSVAARVTLNGGAVRDNTAGLGGGLYAERGSRVHLGGGALRSNSAADGGAIWIEPLDNLTADASVSFDGNSADTAVQRPAEADVALHARNIKTGDFSLSFAYAYNNYDVVYDGGEVLEQEHTVRFEYEGAGALERERTVRHGEPVGALPVPARSGYSLAGWYTAPQAGTAYSSDTTVTESVTLYARWRANSYTLRFDYNGEAPPDEDFLQKTVTFDEPVGQLPLAVSEEANTSFTGWFDANGKHYFPATPYRVAGDLTLYAGWSPVSSAQHIVRFHYNEADSGVVEDERLVADGEPVGELPLPERSGKRFGGWYSESGEGPWLQTAPVTGVLDLYALWLDPPYIVRFHTMGADVTLAESEREVFREQPLGALPAPELPGLVWRGWYADLQWSQPVDASTVPEGDMDLYARWEGEVRFDYQDASNEDALPDSKPVVYGQMLGVLPLPVKTGYLFSGWYSEPEGAGRYYGGGTSGKAFAQTEPLQLFVNWDEETYTIRFEYQGGLEDGMPRQKTVLFGDNVGALPFPEHESLRFGGWFTRPGGEGERCFVSTPYLYAGNVTLYAHWLSGDEPGPQPGRAEGVRVREWEPLRESQSIEDEEIPHANPNTGR